jgi:hypothetical protein
MIVRCLRIIHASGREITEHSRIAVGQEFVVLEICCTPPWEPRLRVANPERLPRHRLPSRWPASMFEVLDPSIPPNWEVQVGLGDSPGYVTIGPRSWQRPGFWEYMSDWSPLSAEATADYDRELEIMLAHAARTH